ncbi:hypothetical protein GCM10009555_103830 [Acrocarpospora macrocephala]|uniref:Branched-chain amino acid ABC transporter permease n=1 Tax=Acrocarpospora macrocephala TaxID=150177 RepID=A0A5M3X8B8_9ACTN|nr:branched-chain amino acid ABC transporter permease [Acrocarpospora macrocephala]GES15761.1 hypothetical protein Amac_093590 [Acrocarpospora macrocephala]
MTAVLSHGLSSGALAALFTVGIALAWRVVGLIDFHLPAVFVVAGYGSVSFQDLGLPLLPSAVLGVGVAAGYAALLFLLVHRPLLRRGANPDVVLIATLGLLAMAQATLGWVYGPVRRYPFSGVQATVEIVGFRFSAADLAAIGLAILLIPALLTFLRRTSLGLSLEALSENRQLALVTGVNEPAAQVLTYALVAVFAGAAGVVSGVVAGVDPAIGVGPFLVAFGAVLVGGHQSLVRPVVAAVLLQIVVALISWQLPAQWDRTVLFTAIVATFLTRRIVVRQVQRRRVTQLAAS